MSQSHASVSFRCIRSPDQSTAANATRVLRTWTTTVFGSIIALANETASPRTIQHVLTTQRFFFINYPLTAIYGRYFFMFIAASCVVSTSFSISIFSHMWWPAPSQPMLSDATMMRIMGNLLFMIMMQWLPLIVYSFLSLFVWGLLFQTLANIFQNLTTNERMNSDRYSHFRDSSGKYANRWA